MSNNRLKYKDNEPPKKPQSFQVNSAEGRAYWGVDILWIMLATAEDTNGQYSCIEQLLPHSPAAGDHIHEAADETFYILEGEATFFVEDQPIKATAGSFVSIPRGTNTLFKSILKGHDYSILMCPQVLSTRSWRRQCLPKRAHCLPLQYLFPSRTSQSSA